MQQVATFIRCTIMVQVADVCLMCIGQVVSGSRKGNFRDIQQPNIPYYCFFIVIFLPHIESSQPKVASLLCMYRSDFCTTIAEVYLVSCFFSKLELIANKVLYGCLKQVLSQVCSFFCIYSICCLPVISACCKQTKKTNQDFVFSDFVFFSFLCTFVESQSAVRLVSGKQFHTVLGSVFLCHIQLPFCLCLLPQRAMPQGM